MTLIPNAFSLGGIAAENDILLSSAYCDIGDYQAIESKQDPRCILIGRTGSGKSAALSHLESTHPKSVIRIIPESLSLPYVSNLSVIHQLLDIDVHLEPFLRTLWKHIIVVEVLKHRYHIDSIEKRRNVLSMLMDKLGRDPAKVRALEYLQEFGDRFWCETDERVRQIAESFEKKLSAAGSTELSLFPHSVKGSLGEESVAKSEIKREVTLKYQRIVNESQLPRLNEMLVILHDAVLDSPHCFTYIIIDDLDKDWIDESLYCTVVRCLFDAILDMKKVKNLKIIVSVRTNILEKLGYGADSRAGQEEKLKDLTVRIRWGRDGMLALLEQRFAAASEFYAADPPFSLKSILPNANRNAGNPVTYILDHTLMRPRDAIDYLNECVKLAKGRNKITWEHIRGAETHYSEERLAALRDEWKDPYVDIGKVFSAFRGKRYQMSNDELTSCLGDVALLVADSTFQGGSWLSPICERVWLSNVSWWSTYGELVSLLYRLCFLGVCKREKSNPVFAYEENSQVLNEESASAAYFAIHPAFRLALNLRGQNASGSEPVAEYP